jgi:hypothetical protein
MGQVQTLFTSKVNNSLRTLEWDHTQQCQDGLPGCRREPTTCLSRREQTIQLTTDPMR